MNKSLSVFLDDAELEKSFQKLCDKSRSESNKGSQSEVLSNLSLSKGSSDSLSIDKLKARSQVLKQLTLNKFRNFVRASEKLKSLKLRSFSSAEDIESDTNLNRIGGNENEEIIVKNILEQLSVLNQELVVQKKLLDSINSEIQVTEEEEMHLKHHMVEIEENVKTLLVQSEEPLIPTCKCIII